MKTKIVLWGENEKEEKILLGIELVETENLIRIHVIPEADATEIFYNQMMNQWREGQTIPMPESTMVTDRPLSMTESLLPDNIKTQRQDILARAKTEWHFVILSSKLYEAYADEIGQIKERIDELVDFDAGIWEEMKAFWHKVQDQVQEKNLFREHAAELRTKTNELFDSLKSLKRAMNDEFERASKEHMDSFYEKLQNIEERIEKGLGLQPIFNELKDIQHRFKNTQFTRKHHNDVWKRLDGAFKKVKEKKFGKAQSGGSSATNRLTRRFDGLLSAIGKMEQSINRDIKDKEFQEKRIGTTDGQLEMQIRQAKMAMIEERIASKQTKLDDMLKTRKEIEKKIEIETARAAKKEEQRQTAKEVKMAEKSIKEDIAKQIEVNAEELKSEDDKLQKAAEAIKETKTRKTSNTPVTQTDEQMASTGADVAEDNILANEEESVSTGVEQPETDNAESPLDSESSDKVEIEDNTGASEEAKESSEVKEVEGGNDDIPVKSVAGDQEQIEDNPITSQETSDAAKAEVVADNTDDTPLASEPGSETEIKGNKDASVEATVTSRKAEPESPADPEPEVAASTESEEVGSETVKSQVGASESGSTQESETEIEEAAKEVSNTEDSKTEINEEIESSTDHGEEE